jgi:arylsulfatase
VGETFDIGADTGTPVDDKDSQVPFRFTGKLNKLTVQVGPMQLHRLRKRRSKRRLGRGISATLQGGQPH